MLVCCVPWWVIPVVLLCCGAGLVGQSSDILWKYAVYYWWVSLVDLCCGLVGQSSDILRTGSGPVQCQYAVYYWWVSLVVLCCHGMVGQSIQLTPGPREYLVASASQGPPA